MIGEQTTIFDALARSTDPDTSHAAAARTDGKQLGWLVHAYLLANGPRTSHQVADGLGLSLVTVSPRMKPLESLGLVERAGKVDGRTLWKGLRRE